MEEVVDHLAQLKNQDQDWKWTFHINKLYARQDDKTKIPRSYISRDTTLTETTEQGADKAREGGRTRTTKKQQRKSDMIDMYAFKRQTKGGKTTILSPLGGQWGILHKGLVEVGKIMKKAQYIEPPLQLLKVIPDSWISITDESQVKVAEEMEVRNGRLGQVMVPVAWEYVENVPDPVTVRLHENAVCPLGHAEVAQLVHGLNDLAFGPHKRCLVTTIDIQPIK